MSFRRRLLRLALLSLAASMAASCGKKADPEKPFIGQWVSSRTNTPIHILEGGAWEIRGASGEILQGGGWELKSGNFVWAYRRKNKTEFDSNPIVRMQDNSFELREQDGSVTQFRRVKQ
jgi:hypothetical protein